MTLGLTYDYAEKIQQIAGERIYRYSYVEQRVITRPANWPL